MLEISATILQRAKVRRRGSELAFKRPISSFKYPEYAGISRSGVEGRVLETFGLPDIADQRVVAPYFAILKHP